MYLYSIMPLYRDHIEEICADIIEQCNSGVADTPLFMIRLVPEGIPAIDKAAIECAVFDKYRAILEPAGVPCGILVQCTIGHGYPLDKDFGFQHYIGLSTGTRLARACPFDKEMQEYLRSSFATIASHHPSVIMVDDDFRMLSNWDFGCACPLHMAEFNRRSGENLTREELFDIVKHRHASKRNEKLTKIYEAVEHDSLLEGAHAMREGIDSVDPKIQGAFCIVGIETCGDIAEILAGKGNPSILRLNNGRYTPNSTRELGYRSMYRAAVQAHLAANKADVYLAETDTCPQNRYSTSAQSLHVHFTASILEGLDGAKHWITRLTSYEPASGKGYRKKLGENAGFYNALAKLVPTIKWRGCRVPLPSVLDFNYDDPYEPASAENGWFRCVFDRFGLPFYFSEKSGGTALIDAPTPGDFSDEELTEMLRGTVILSAKAADAINQRGLGAYTGVTVRPWKGENVTGERVDEINLPRQKDLFELVPVDDTVIVDSLNYHLKDGVESYPLFPACTVYRNSLGGTSIVFCGTPLTDFVYFEFSFLSETRKKQFIRLLKQFSDLPVYYPDDLDVNLRVGDLPDGTLFCSFINISLDPIEKITLKSDLDFTSIEKMTPGGKRIPVNFTREGDLYTLDTPAWTQEPVILFMK